MLHQPSGGATGTAADIQLQAKEIIYMKETIAGILSTATGQTVARIKEDSERDFFMSAQEAVAYGLADEVLIPKPPAAPAAAPAA